MPSSGSPGATRCRASRPRSRASTASPPKANWPFWAATKQSSMTWATRTAASTPTIRAAPLTEWAARIRASKRLGWSGSFSRASSPSFRTGRWTSSSARKRSSSDGSKVVMAGTGRLGAGEGSRRKDRCAQCTARAGTTPETAAAIWRGGACADSGGLGCAMLSRPGRTGVGLCSRTGRESMLSRPTTPGQARHVSGGRESMAPRIPDTLRKRFTHLRFGRPLTGTAPARGRAGARPAS